MVVLEKIFGRAIRHHLIKEWVFEQMLWRRKVILSLYEDYLHVHVQNGLPPCCPRNLMDVDDYYVPLKNLNFIETGGHLQAGLLLVGEIIAKLGALSCVISIVIELLTTRVEVVTERHKAWMWWLRPVFQIFLRFSVG